MFENISQHYGSSLTAFNKTALEKFQEMTRAYVTVASKDKNQVQFRLRKGMQKKVKD